MLIGNPEFNYSVSGPLKNALDWLSRVKGPNAWEKKPIAIIGCAAGMSGSLRSLYELKKVLEYHGGIVLGKECNIA